MTLRTLPLPQKVLATCFLLTIGIAYLFAIAYLYLIDVEPHTKHGVSILQAVIIKYYGKREASRLEAALEGPMGAYTTPGEKQQLIEWIRQGASEADFVNIQPVIEKSCATCHSKESGMPIPPLTTHAEVSHYTTMDLGQSIKSLVRVSHIHLFGMSFIFMLTGFVFSFSDVSILFRTLLIALPFVAIWVDIGSWWFTNYQPWFAYTVIGGGILMGISLAGHIGISLYEMWLGRRTEME